MEYRDLFFLISTDGIEEIWLKEILRRFPSSFRFIFDSLEESRNVKMFVFSGLTFLMEEDSFFSRILSCIQKNTSLRMIDAANFSVSIQNFKKLLIVLDKKPNIDTIAFSNFPFKRDKAKFFFEFMKQNKTLRRLELSKCGIRSMEGCLFSNNTVTELDLCENSITSSGFEDLCKSLKGNTALTKLDISHNVLDNLPMNLLGELLSVNSSLETLYLSYNYIGDEAFAPIANSLLVNTTLSTLKLDNNRLGPISGMRIGTILSVNSSLTSLDIFANPFKNMGCFSIAKGLSENNSLTHLDITSIGCDKIAAEIIFSSLLKNTSLVELRMWYNTFSFKDLTDSVLQVIEQNTTLVDFYFDSRSAFPGIVDLFFVPPDPNFVERVLDSVRKNFSICNSNWGPFYHSGVLMRNQEIRAETAKVKKTLYQLLIEQSILSYFK